jgi:hypothetical protein
MSETARPNPRRKPGAQPGNHNARKTGLYSSRENPLELLRLRQVFPGGVGTEIAVLRLFLRRVLAHPPDPTNQPQTLSTLRAVCQAAYIITRLVRIDCALDSLPPVEPSPLGALAALPLTPGEIETLFADLFDSSAL